MTTQLSNEETEALLAIVEEDSRLARLSDSELVKEALSRGLCDDPVGAELMNRVHRNWAYDDSDETRPQRVYVAGPMTGYTDLNYPAFAETANVLRNAGYEVVSPAELNPITTEYMDAMRKDIQALIRCDQIWMLKGWAKSKGAMLEFQIANCLGLRIRGEF